MKTTILVLLLGALASPGCAYTRVQRFDVTSHEGRGREATASGVRYYEGAPHILVYSTPGHYASKLVWLPDTRFIYSAQPIEVMATNTTTLSFEAGVLKSSKVVTDATTIPKSILAVVKDAAEAAAKLAAANVAPIEDTEVKPEVHLFRLEIEIDENGRALPRLFAAEPVEIDVKSV